MKTLPTLLAALSICSLITGCALFQSTKGAETSFEPHKQVFAGEFDAVWRATQIVFSSYAIRVNNYDSGLIETEIIDGFNAWTPAHHPDAKPEGTVYKITARVLKGKSEGKNAHQVSILKTIMRKRDFFSESEKIPSDGLEEKNILYRIGREVTIDRGLQKSSQR